MVFIAIDFQSYKLFQIPIAKSGPGIKENPVDDQIAFQVLALF